MRTEYLVHKAIPEVLMSRPFLRGFADACAGFVGVLARGACIPALQQRPGR